MSAVAHRIGPQKNYQNNEKNHLPASAPAALQQLLFGPDPATHRGVAHPHRHPDPRLDRRNQHRAAAHGVYTRFWRASDR